MPRATTTPAKYSPAKAAVRAETLMRRSGAAPVVVRGAITGRLYQFTAGRTVQAVDARDVAGLLRHGLGVVNQPRENRHA